MDRARVTPLNLAVYNSHWDTAKLLLENGAPADDDSLILSVQQRNRLSDGTNPYDIRNVPQTADRTDALAVIALLLERGARADNPLNKILQAYDNGFGTPMYLSGMTPLRLSALHADVPTMRLLLAHGADPNRIAGFSNVYFGGQNQSAPLGNTALLAAVRSVVGTIGSSVGPREPGLAYRSRTKGPEDTLGAVELLLRNGADVNKADWQGTTPLHIAARFGANGVIELLARNGAQVDVQDDDDQTPLDIALMMEKQGSRKQRPARRPVARPQRQISA